MRVRVVNAGVPGYTIFQGWVYLQDRGLQLDPDALVLYFGLNDFLPVAFREQRASSLDGTDGGLTDRELFLQRRRPMSRALDSMYRWSNLVRSLGSLLHGGSRVEGRNDGEPVVGRATDAVRVPEDDRWAALVAIQDLCRRRHIDLVVVIPWYRDFDAHAPLLRRFASEYAVTTVDLPALLAPLPAPRASYFQDAVHPNADGQRVIASAILAVVGSRWRAELRGSGAAE